MTDVIKKLINNDEIYDLYDQIVVMGALMGYDSKIYNSGNEFSHYFYLNSHKMFRLDFTFSVNFQTASFDLREACIRFGGKWAESKNPIEIKLLLKDVLERM